jgi:hypothetical protein
MAMSAHSERLDQLEERNAVGGHAGEMEAVPGSAASPSLTPAFPSLQSSAGNQHECWRVDSTHVDQIRRAGRDDGCVEQLGEPVNWLPFLPLRERLARGG